MTHDSSPRKQRRHCNELNGRRWLQNSISVWSDIRKTPEESRLDHPALFPQMLVERLIETFLPPEGNVVLDPFAGSGSTVLTARRMGKQGIGLELSPEYVRLARTRLAELKAGDRHPQQPVEKRYPGEGEAPAEPRPQNSGSAGASPSPFATGFQNSREPVPFFQPSVVHQASAAELPSLVGPASVDLCVTSPPYWNILNQRRTADQKAVRHYGNLADDLGTIADYHEFLDALAAVFGDVLTALRPGAYCCIVVMDLRKKDRFFPLHSDLAARLTEVGYLYDDLLIWNRQAEYNNLRPLGYPSVFRVNKVHEFVLLMQKSRG